MKKLFSTMLAATMVAGTAVTAFAGISNTPFAGGDRDDFKDQDYAVIGAYDEDGVIIDKKDNVDGGDKLYFPILVSGEELDDEANKDNEMFFVTKKSDIDDLKANVKDEVGGKYIDNAAIVKKNIKIDKDGDVAGKYVDKFEDFTADKGVLQTAVDNYSGVKVTAGSIKDGKEATAVTATLDTKGTPAKNEPVTGITGITVTAHDADATADATVKVTVDATAGTVIFGSGSPITVVGAGEQNITEGQTKFTVTQAGLDALVAVDGESDITLVKHTPAKPGTPEDLNVTVEYKQAEAGKDFGGDVTAELNGKDLKFIVTGKNNGTSTGSSIGKIYCVEVEMSDYFKSEETEVEFNITLKNNGRTEFDSEDDSLKGYWFADFDLGKDSEGLVDNVNYVSDYEVDFDKDGDLELEIGPKTRSVQLDEAKLTANGKDIDIENIFLESVKEIDCAFTFEVKASGQDDLYLELNDDAVKDLAVSNQKADLTFFNFPGEPEFDFAGTATFTVEDEDEDNYFYEIVDGELVETNAKYDSRDGVFELRTNKLGSYVLSDRELDTAKEKADEKADDTESKPNENGGGDATEAVTPGANGEKGNANTGAADLIGVASALAVVSVAAAGAVALKK